MEPDNYEIQVLLRHYWKKGLKAVDAAREICHVEGEDAVAERTAQKWFERFEDGHTEIKDYPHTVCGSLLIINSFFCKRVFTVFIEKLVIVKFMSKCQIGQFNNFFIT